MGSRLLERFHAPAEFRSYHRPLRPNESHFTLRKYRPGAPVPGSQGSWVLNERFLFAGVKGQVFVPGAEVPRPPRRRGLGTNQLPLAPFRSQFADLCHLHQSQRNGTSRNTRKTHQKHAKYDQNWQILATNTTTRGSIHGNFHRCDKVFSARSQKFGQSAHPQGG